jgi:hypothetical protein
VKVTGAPAARVAFDALSATTSAGPVTVTVALAIAIWPFPLLTGRARSSARWSWLDAGDDKNVGASVTTTIASLAGDTSLCQLAWTAAHQREKGSTEGSRGPAGSEKHLC